MYLAIRTCATCPRGTFNLSARTLIATPSILRSPVPVEADRDPPSTGTMRVRTSIGHD